MSDLEVFWGATAATAPVVALAHAVTAGRYLGWQNSIMMAIRERKSTDDAKAETMPETVEKFNAFKRQAMMTSNILGVAIWVSLLAVASCGLAMYQSLTSLRDNSGASNLATAVIWELIIPIVAVLVQAGIEAGARFLARVRDLPLEFKGCGVFESSAFAIPYSYWAAPSVCDCLII